MPTNRLAYTKTPASQRASEGMLPASNPSNYGNATSKVINLNNNNWLGDSVVFTVDSAWRYVVHVRNTHNGASSIHIDDVRVYGMNTATYLACDTASGGYRFGFGGQEKDNEITGVEGSHNTAEFWMYDTRLGRRWNVDPVDQISISNYACFYNNPIYFVDIKGNNGGVTVDKNNKTVTVTTKVYYSKADNYDNKVSDIKKFMENTCGVMEGEYWIDMNKPTDGTNSGTQEQDVWKVIYKTEFVEVDADNLKAYENKVNTLRKSDPYANFLFFDNDKTGSNYSTLRNITIGTKGFNPSKARNMYEHMGKSFTHEKGHSLGLLHASNYKASSHYNDKSNGGYKKYGEQQSYADVTYLYDYEVQISVTNAINVAKTSEKNIIHFIQLSNGNIIEK